jgi:hypothetical protein
VAHPGAAVKGSLEVDTRMLPARWTPVHRVDAADVIVWATLEFGLDNAPEVPGCPGGNVRSRHGRICRGEAGRAPWPLTICSPVSGTLRPRLAKGHPMGRAILAGAPIHAGAAQFVANRPMPLGRIIARLNRNKVPPQPFAIQWGGSVE